MSEKIVLELPNTKKEVEIKGQTYTLDVNDMAMVRKMVELYNNAMNIARGKIPSDEETEQIVAKCKETVDLAFGKDTFDQIFENELKEKQYLAPLYVCAQISRICMEEYNAYKRQYTKSVNIDEQMAEIDKYMNAIAKMKKIEQEMDHIR